MKNDPIKDTLDTLRARLRDLEHEATTVRAARDKGTTLVAGARR